MKHLNFRMRRAALSQTVKGFRLFAISSNKWAFFIFYTASFLSSFGVFGQACPQQPVELIQNGDFEVCSVPPLNLIDAAFNIGCIPTWFSGNGTPSICNNWFGVSAYEGTNYACLSSTINNSGGCEHNEAIFVSVDLCAGATYRLNFHYRSLSLNGEGQISVVLDKNIQPIFDPLHPGQPCFNSTGQDIFSETIHENNEWVGVQKDFVASASGAYQLAFYPTPTNIVSGHLDIGIDAVSLTCISSGFSPEFTIEEICPGEYLFTGSQDDVPGSVTSWCWDLGDGDTGSGQSVTHNYLSGGVFDVCLSINTDYCSGCLSAVCHEIDYDDLSITKSYTEDFTIGLLTFTIDVGNNLNTPVDVIVFDFLSNAFTVVNPNGFSASGNVLQQTVPIPALSHVELQFTATRNCWCLSVSNCAQVRNLSIQGTPCGWIYSCIEVSGFSTYASGDFTCSIDPINCNRATFNAIYSDEDNCTQYLWDFGDGNSTTGSTATHQYTSNGTYDISLTVSTPCGNHIVQKSITIDCSAPPGFTCPCSAGGLNIDASENSQFYDPALGGTPFAALEAAFNYDQDNDGDIEPLEHNNCIAILGNLIVDQGLKIENCQNVQMQPCSKITVSVPAPGNLYLHRNTVYSCDTMWHGIAVNPLSTLKLESNTIRDAQFAISAIGAFGAIPGPNTTINVKGNNFANNHVGVFFPGNFQKFVVHYPITGNTFESTADLLPPCDANLPNYSSTLRGYAGIVTLGTPLTVGTLGAGGADNYFKLIRNGIISENAMLFVNRADFQDIIGGQDQNPPSFAAAIGNGVVAVNGKADVWRSNFSTVPRGVFGHGNKMLTVRNNTMHGMLRGVETLSVGRLTISDNPVIEFADRGMLCREVVPNNGLPNAAHRIENNPDMHLVSIPAGPVYFASAIEIDNAMSVHIGKGRIGNNRFTSGGNFAHGIRINGSGGWDIDENEVVLEASATSASVLSVGIHLTNTHENYLYHNIVEDMAPGFNEAAALSLSIGTGNRYCCNVTNGSRFGSRFFGACTATEWRVTDMLDHEFALFCDAGTVISNQPDYGNSFGDGSGTAFHGGQDQDVLNSQFRVVNMDVADNHWPEAISTPNATVDFFLDEGYAPGCTAPCVAPQFAPYPPDRDIHPSDLATAVGGWTGGEYGAALQWESGRRLYERMSDYEGLLGDHAATDAFYSAANSGKIGTYYDAERYAKGIYGYPTNIQNDLAQSLAQLESNLLAVETVLAGLASATNYADSMAIYQNANTLYASAQTALGILHNAEALAQAFQNAQATNGLSVTNALTSDNLLEQNRKTVQQLYLQTIGLGIAHLTPQQLAEAEAIAVQCPLEGGSAVYAARALYRLNIDRVFMDDSLCSTSQERRAVEGKMLTSYGKWIRLIPNPAADFVTVEGLDISQDQLVEISLLDITGKLCLSRIVEQGDIVLSTATLSEGVYICQVKLQGKPPVSLKLIIVH